MIAPDYAPCGLLAGKVAVITGAGRGIGKVIARAFVAEGARVLVSDFSGEEEATAAELGASAVAFRADMTKEEDIEAMFVRAVEVYGKIDNSVHVAGNPGGRWGDEVTAEEYKAVTSTHLHGMMFCCKHAVRAMADSGGGSIVNFSSVASLNYDPVNSFVYSSAKAGINSLTKSYAGRYGTKGIRVNAIAPGFTLSEKNLTVPDAVFQRLSNKSSLERAGFPEEQAAVAVFLASDRSSFVTGVTIPVDGGWSARLA